MLAPVPVTDRLEPTNTESSSPDKFERFTLLSLILNTSVGLPDCKTLTKNLEVSDPDAGLRTSTPYLVPVTATPEVLLKIIL